MEHKIERVRIELVIGDIAAQEGIDVVVNAANAELMPGGGVAGAIHQSAGPELAEACRDLAPIEPGQAVITEAFDLPNRYVVHCLGPVYGKDEPADVLLSSCYRSALLLADEHAAKSIAFPAISTGVFGYPIDAAAEIALETVVETIPDLQSLELVRFALFSERDLKAHEAALEALSKDADGA
jgi:O-acetyl-ADP-ribose deacetylase